MAPGMVRLDTLTCGPFAAERLPVNVVESDGPVPAVLGMDVMGTRACEFDLAREVLTLDLEPPRAEGIPLRRQSGGQPLVPVSFGHVKTDAVWDTGASLSVLDAGWASRSGVACDLVPADDGVDASGAAVPSSTGTLGGCTIGEVDFLPTRCAVVDLGPLNAHLDEPITLILGLPVIRQARWWMDFPSNRWHVQT